MERYHISTSYREWSIIPKLSINKDHTGMWVKHKDVESLEAENKKLRSWIKENSEHDIMCVSYEVPTQPCDCGLDNLLKGGTNDN